MKKLLILFLFAITANTITVYGQITIEQCQQKAQANYPEIKQYGLIEQSTAYTLSNANKAYLPQFSLSAKATYQSDVTKIPPINLPNITIQPPSTSQYQTVAEASQLIWDGGAVQAQKAAARASGEVSKQSVKVDLYALNDRINQLFFGILSLNDQLQQNSLLQNELQTDCDKIKAYIQNGVANQADLDNMYVEKLNAQQNRIQLETVRKAYVEMLSTMIGSPVNPDQLTAPEMPVSTAELLVNKRPELDLFNAKKLLFDSQRKSIDAANFPKINFFIQGGYGRPGLNMLDNTPSPYYIGGVKLSWNFGGLYTQKNNLRIIETNQQIIESQRATFLFNTQLQAMQQSNAIDQWRQLIKNDDEIIQLRHNVKVAAEAKVANGTMSVTDLIREITAENQAMVNKSLHQVQLMQAVYDLKNTTNN
ncbi:MAG: TolC family protein [Microbacter sp.]